MLCHFDVRFKVYGLGLMSLVGKVEFFSSFFLILWFGVVGSIPGVGKVENWIIVGKKYLSTDKKGVVA